MPSKAYPHLEERPEGASRRTQGRSVASDLNTCPASQRLRKGRERLRVSLSTAAARGTSHAAAVWRKAEEKMRVGFIGLGMMGKGMAANLQKAGHELVVHDLSRVAAEPFLAKGAVWANSPKQVGEQSEVVFTSLPVPADVEQVALGSNGLIEGMRRDTAFFDMSTNSVATVRKIHAAFAEKNLYMLDSPVSCGPSGASDYAALI